MGIKLDFLFVMKIKVSGLEQMKAGKMTENQARTAIRDLHLPTDIQSFKKLSVAEAMKVYEAATPEERHTFNTPMKQKIYDSYEGGNWPIGKPIPTFDDEDAMITKVGQEIVRKGKKYRVVSFDKDGQPMVEPAK